MTNSEARNILTNFQFDDRFTEEEIYAIRQALGALDDIDTAKDLLTQACSDFRFLYEVNKSNITEVPYKHYKEYPITIIGDWTSAYKVRKLFGSHSFGVYDEYISKQILLDKLSELWKESDDIMNLKLREPTAEIKEKDTMSAVEELTDFIESLPTRKLIGE